MRLPHNCSYGRCRTVRHALLKGKHKHRTHVIASFHSEERRAFCVISIFDDSFRHTSLWLCVCGSEAARRLLRRLQYGAAA